MFLIALVSKLGPSSRLFSTTPMAPIISQLFNITVAPGFDLQSQAFRRLRDVAREQGGAKEQYYGIDREASDRLCWVVQWPNTNSEPSTFNVDDFRDSVNALDIDNAPRSWYVPFEDAELPRSSLTAPLTEFACVHLASKEKTESTSKSLHQTFVDCYDAPDGGFVGGHWGTANNDERMNWYYLGWATREHHTKYAKTPLFAVEIDKLAPFMDDGYAVFVKLTREVD